MRGQATAGVAEPTSTLIGVNNVSNDDLAVLLNKLDRASRNKTAAKHRLVAAEQQPEILRLRECEAKYQEELIGLTNDRDKKRRLLHRASVERSGKGRRQQKKNQNRRAKTSEVEYQISVCRGNIAAVQQEIRGHLSRLVAELKYRKSVYYAVREEVLEATEAGLQDVSYKQELMLLAGVPQEYSVADVRFYEVRHDNGGTDIHLHYGGIGSPGGPGDGHHHLHIHPDGIAELVFHRHPAQYTTSPP